MQIALKKALEERLIKDRIILEGKEYFSLPLTSMEFAGKFSVFGTSEFEIESRRNLSTFHKWARVDKLPHHYCSGRNSKIFFEREIHDHLLDLVTPKKACILTAISYPGMRNWIKEGKLNQLKTPGNTYAFSIKELRTVMKEKYEKYLKKSQVPVFLLPENISEYIGFKTREKFIQAVTESTNLDRLVLQPLITEIGFIPREAYNLIEYWSKGNIEKINSEYLESNKKEILEKINRIKLTREQILRILSIYTGFSLKEITKAINPDDSKKVPRGIELALSELNFEIKEYDDNLTYNKGNIIKISNPYREKSNLGKNGEEYILGIITEIERRRMKVKREDLNGEIIMSHQNRLY